MSYYTGIGARNTPKDVLTHMEYIAGEYAKRGYTLRSGGAKGADSAFEAGCDSFGGRKEIYLPWPGFDGKEGIVVNNKAAEDIAGSMHPAWDKCRQSVKKLHTRNVYQMVGAELTAPSNLMVCWTPEGKEVGGTGQAIRLAKYFNITIINLAVWKGE